MIYITKARNLPTCLQPVLLVLLLNAGRVLGGEVGGRAHGADGDRDESQHRGQETHSEH